MADRVGGISALYGAANGEGWIASALARLAMTGKSSPSPLPSSHAKAGDPVRRASSMSSPKSLAYWVVRCCLSSGAQATGYPRPGRNASDDDLRHQATVFFFGLARAGSATSRIPMAPMIRRTVANSGLPFSPSVL